MHQLLVATRKGLFEFEESGDGWAVVDRSFIGDNCFLAMRDPRTGMTFASLGHGHFGPKLHRRSEGSATWEEIAVPVYPEMPAGHVPMQPVEGEPAPWRLSMIWGLAPGGADQPGRIWCGTLPGGLFQSDDNGSSWRLCESLWRDERRELWFGGGMDEPGIHSICVDPRDSRRVSVAVSCGGVWHSEDDGATWTLAAKGMRAEFLPPEMVFFENSQDPHCMDQCASEPARMWVQHHNGIFRSDDYGRSWSEIQTAEPSAFGFAVRVDPTDPDTAWFVPGVSDETRVPVDGALCVTRTRDGGKTFEQLRNGLPQTDGWDIVLRHALDVSACGRTVAFGSTTGNLYVSNDQGDSFVTVSHSLPPIYALQLF